VSVPLQGLAANLTSLYLDLARLLGLQVDCGNLTTSLRLEALRTQQTLLLGANVSAVRVLPYSLESPGAFPSASPSAVSSSSPEAWPLYAKVLVSLGALVLLGLGAGAIIALWARGDGKGQGAAGRRDSYAMRYSSTSSATGGRKGFRALIYSHSYVPGQPEPQGRGKGLMRIRNFLKRDAEKPPEGHGAQERDEERDVSVDEPYGPAPREVRFAGLEGPEEVRFPVPPFPRAPRSEGVARASARKKGRSHREGPKDFTSGDFP